MKLLALLSLAMVGCNVEAPEKRKFVVGDCVAHKDHDIERWSKPPHIYKIEEVGKYGYRETWEGYETMDLGFLQEPYHEKVRCP